ncbi:protein cereblon [Leptopilina boulardi]|uniref:protein cereblon n=1 Tax=Leptopilina boulardi TaxID=63433 RepID=UPI0021F5B5C8|nr:protein cereblon [Leptopilina boulardi]
MENTEAENDVQQSNDNNTFDITLSSTHSYLGNNLEELRGRTLLDEGIYMNLPLLIKQSVVLFPGQTLPLTVFDRQTIEMLQQCINKNRIFGVVCRGYDNLISIGTTAEIYEYIEGSPMEGFRIKAKGRQRFKILHITQGYGKYSANVKIVPEINLGLPLWEARNRSLDNLRQQSIIREKIERYDSISTQWPSWLIKRYNINKLTEKIHMNLDFIEKKGSHIPNDPIELSFWVGQNLPLVDNKRIALLNYDCAIPRLQKELNYLIKDRCFVCNKCNLFIGKQSDMFPMNREGPQGTYCNLGGFLYETVTLYKAQGLILSGNEPSSEYSWFPGYAWTIVTCQQCQNHMGWLFTAENNNLRPKSFWGLTRRGLRSKRIGTKETDYEESFDRSDSDTDYGGF